MAELNLVSNDAFAPLADVPIAGPLRDTHARRSIMHGKGLNDRSFADRCRCSIVRTRPIPGHETPAPVRHSLPLGGTTERSP